MELSQELKETIANIAIRAIKENYIHISMIKRMVGVSGVIPVCHLIIYFANFTKLAIYITPDEYAQLLALGKDK